MPDIIQIKDTRIIYLNGIITDEVALIFNTTLLQLEHENPKEDITVYINSPGGSVSAGLSMIDTMLCVSSNISTVGVGMAASMGALLLMAGTRGKRKMLQHSKVLLHQPMGSFEGENMQASDIEIVARDLARTKKDIYELISQCTSQPYEKVCQDCDRDYTLSAKEALEYGVIDEIIGSHKLK